MQTFNELTSEEKTVVLGKLREKIADYIYRKGLVTGRLKKNAKIALEGFNHSVPTIRRN
jgi:hypothetical protein